MPLLREKIIGDRGIVINSVSGTSGAGRGGSVDLLFSEVNESVRAYKVGTHQHIPEIRGMLGIAAGSDVSMTFTPHLMPITRGIYSTICAPLTRECGESDIAEIYGGYYATAPFVRWSSTAVPEIRGVAHSNYIDIGFRVDADNGQVVIMAAIDNLVKGAAGQAVQNMNILFGFEETEGLR
jgi:N-acetyl-gamma-glutamyl-phosphate reductase